MNIGFFGGSFDPIHRGHLALAQAAASRYALRQVLFVPANVPPHKQKQPLTAFIHRYAMVALATQDERGFVPSLLEEPEFTAAKVRSAGQPGAAVPTFASIGLAKAVRGSRPETGCRLAQPAREPRAWTALDQARLRG